MTANPVETRCPRCGETSTGRFCTGCGAPLRDVKCEACGHLAAPGARFCAECAAPLAAGAASSRGAARQAMRPATLTAGAAVLVLVAFLAGQVAGRRSTPGAGPADQGPTVPLASSSGTAPDISAMSPEERASRLFNRVMLYSEQGHLDSARFFAPMAIQAYEMIGPADAHMRYDIGVISAAIGDVGRARAEADTILAAQPNHLLGLVLAIRAAELSKDRAAVAKFSRRLVTAAPAERAKGLKEYGEHARDIDDALTKATAASR